jgi:bla regulator protein blaR1
MRKIALGVCLVAGMAVVSAQPPSPPASASQGQAPDYVFEVATIKQNKSGERGGGIRRLPGGRVTVTNMPARGLVTFAYQLGQWQLSGGPGWLADDKFDITAKIEGNPEWEGPGSGRPDPIQISMRKLLAERFKLKVHTEMRDLDAYALVMVKPGSPGPELKPSTTDCKALAEQLRQGKQPPGGPPPADGIMPCSIMGRIGQLAFDGFPMAQAATMFVGQAGRPVVDRTNLTGNWRFLMKFQQAPPQGMPAGPEAEKIAAAAANPDLPSFFTALQEQLGLKLESTKAPFQVTVIDSVEHPTED